MADDRVRCETDCDRYLPHSKGCEAALRGEYVGVPTRHTPVLNVPRRCEYFRPHQGAEDQRSAAERWPGFRENTRGAPSKPAPAPAEELPGDLLELLTPRERVDE